MGHKLDVKERGGGGRLGGPSPGSRSPLRGRSGCCFGDLWFKVFSERGPC